MTFLDWNIFLISTVIILTLLVLIPKVKKYAKQVFSVLKKNIAMVTQYEKKYLIIAVSGSFFRGIYPILSLLVLQKIINLIQIGDKKGKIFLLMLVIYALMEIGNIIINNIYNMYSNKFSKRFSKYVDVLVLEKSARLKTKDFENNETYDLINRAQSQNGNTVISYIDIWISIFEQSITVISSCILLGMFKYWMLILIVIFPALNFVYQQKFARERYKISIKRTSDERRCWYINYLMLLGNANKEIRVYGIGRFFINQFEMLRNKFISEDNKIIDEEFKTGLFTTLASQVVSIFCMVNIFWEGLNKKIFLGNVTTYINCISIIKNGSERILSLLSTAYSMSLHIELLFEYLDINEHNNLETEAKVNINSIDTIELKGINYRFAKDKEYVLKNINLKLIKGESVALIGRNGSGKSTLIKIILGLYEDYEGDIIVNGVDLRSIEKKRYFELISCIFQDYIKYEASVRENVAYGNISKLMDEEMIYESLDNSGLDIAKIGIDTLDTYLGHWFGDIQLSEGQWQKIAISRAVVKDADLYILDEPDAALDSISEKEMAESYKRILKDRMSIIISHKINYVRKLCDYMIVLDAGEISETGTHEELMKKKNMYYKLYNSQVF